MKTQEYSEEAKMIEKYHSELFTKYLLMLAQHPKNETPIKIESIKNKHTWKLLLLMSHRTKIRCVCGLVDTFISVVLLTGWVWHGSGCYGSLLNLFRNLPWTPVTQIVCGTLLYNCLISTCFLWAPHVHWIQTVHRSRWNLRYLLLDAPVSLLTALSKINMLQSSHTYFSKFHTLNFSSRPSPSPSHTHFKNNSQGQQ